MTLIHKTVAVTLLLPLLAAAAGRIEVVGRDSVDFGKYPACEARSNSFVLRNTGDTPVEITQVRKTCGCASASCDKSILKPAETARVDVVMLPDTLCGLYSKNVFVENTDPKNRFLRLNVSGDAVPLVVIRPEASAYLGRIPTNTPTVRSFTLTPTDPAIRLGTPVVEKCDRVRAVLMPETGPSNHPSYALDVVVMSIQESREVRCSVLVPILAPTNRPPVKVEIVARVGDF